MTQVAPFELPWRIAFLPDGRMLITEKIGALWLVTPDGAKTPVTNVPLSVYLGRNGSDLGNGGMLGVYTSPNYTTDHNIYVTYSEPGLPMGSGLALARARLSIADGRSAAPSRFLPTDNSCTSRSVIAIGLHQCRIQISRWVRFSA